MVTIKHLQGQEKSEFEAIRVCVVCITRGKQILIDKLTSTGASFCNFRISSPNTVRTLISRVSSAVIESAEGTSDDNTRPQEPTRKVSYTSATSFQKRALESLYEFTSLLQSALSCLTSSVTTRLKHSADILQRVPLGFSLLVFMHLSRKLSESAYRTTRNLESTLFKRF